MTEVCRTKHLVNSLEDAVWDNLLGFALQHENVKAIEGINVIIRSDFETEVVGRRKIALLSGAGSGHEPMQAGFVGRGGLTATVAGQVFASPTTNQVLSAIRILGRNAEAGVLVTIMNYTGDRLNFGLACERARLEGINVDMFTFSDDVAFYGEGRAVGRRGLAGVVFFNKIIGALAEEGLSVQELKSEADKLNNCIGTMSLSLTACDIPGVGDSFNLKLDEIEVGLGIHGEPGVSRAKLLSSQNAVQLMLDHLLGPQSPLYEILQSSKDDPVHVGLVVNNLGGLSNFEINIIARDAMKELAKRHFVVSRMYCGTFVTSFSMQGVSLSLLKLNETYLSLLDAPVDTAVWPASLRGAPNNSPVLHLEDLGVSPEIDYETNDKLPFDRPRFVSALEAACLAIIKSEDHLNDLDKECGDGDCGSTQRIGASAILEAIRNKTFGGSFLQMANICDTQMGGTSGAISSLLFTGISSVLRKATKSDTKLNLIAVWRDALENGIATISKYSLAQPGDRTMLETLVAVQHVFANHAQGDSEGNSGCDTSRVQLAEEVISAAQEAAESTATMTAKAGRASYVCSSRVNKPDPGAVAVAIWMKAVAETFLE